MKRILPDTKKRTVFFWGLTGKDLLIMSVGLLVLSLILASDLSQNWKIGLFIVVSALLIISVITIDIIKGYQFFYRFINYITRKKKSKELVLSKSVGVDIGEFITIKSGDVGTLHTAVIELNGIDFGVLDEHNQDNKIDIFAEILKDVKNGKIIKMEKHIDFESYIKENESYISEYEMRIGESALNAESTNELRPHATELINKLFSNPKSVDAQKIFSQMTIDEIKMQMLLHQNDYMEYLNDKDRVYQEAFYFVIQDANKNYLNECVENAINGFHAIGLCPVQLKDSAEKKELTSFLARFYSTQKDVDDVNEVRINSTQEKMSRIKIGDRKYRIICCHRYKMFADNCWGWQLFKIPDTKVVFNFRQYAGKDVNRLMNKVVLEIKTQLSDPKIKGTEETRLSGDYQVMDLLIGELEFGNEKLLDTEFYLLYPEENHKKVMKQVRSLGIVVNDMYLSQYEAYLSMFPYNLMLNKSETICHMPSSSAAALFPFVTKQIADEHGVYIGGSSGLPVFFDLFYRDGNRVNSNMCVFGKPGGGKSYFMKALLKSMAALDKRIFILDPDNEYGYLCDTVKGNFIDVSGTSSGIINPLQVYPAFDDDDNGRRIFDEVTAHRGFLEEFFKTILPNMSAYGAALLNNYIKELYIKWKIDETNYKQKQPKDFPIFDDLYGIIKKKYAALEKSAKADPVEKQEHRMLELYMSQFAKGGLYARLWNGHTTLKINNNFNVMNFQTLFAQSNTVIANAQMLLIVKFLNQEVIKNRELGVNNIVIGIDEAHRFINPDFPVALKFMKDMGKQCRKYFCALIVATQNVDDFIGVSENMKSMASAVINNCQYSFIFSLMPDDTNKMKDLYRNFGGGFTKSEVDYITSSKQGDCLFVVDINTRLPVHINVFPDEAVFFLDPKAKQKIERKEIYGHYNV